jgi:hypothetical protein
MPVCEHVAALAYAVELIGCGEELALGEERDATIEIISLIVLSAVIIDELNQGLIEKRPHLDVQDARAEQINERIPDRLPEPLDW